MKSICVFCGSSMGLDEVYRNAARAMGHALARKNIRLVYGGGKVGLMGTVADAVMEMGGTVYGVIPRALFEREVGHTSLTELDIVETMHERKALMADLSDAFIAMPGGAGTLDEIFEQWTWAQLGIHGKPCAFLNINGYYDPLLEMIKRMSTDGFLAAHYVDTLIIETDPDKILERLAAYTPPPRKWITDESKQVKP